MKKCGGAKQLGWAEEVVLDIHAHVSIMRGEVIKTRGFSSKHVAIQKKVWLFTSEDRLKQYGGERGVLLGEKKKKKG